MSAPLLIIGLGLAVTLGVIVMAVLAKREAYAADQRRHPERDGGGDVR